MKTILLIDDWMLDWHQNLTRRFGRPELIDRETVFEEPHAFTSLGKGYMNVIRAPQKGVYQFWYDVAGSRPLPGGNFTSTTCYAESEDGFTWTYPDLGFAEKLGVGEKFRNAVGFDVPPIGAAKVAFDPFDPDPSRRYKLPAQFDSGDRPDFGVFISPDGIEWTYVPDSSWFPVDPARMGTDTDNNMMYNPVTGRYQLICRAACLDRRIAISESDDLVHWTDPQVCLYPDPLSESLVQFYSMSQFWYHDHFIGLMQLQHISSTEMGPAKWLGKCDTELTYSYNGVHWNRTDRLPFIPRTKLGTPGSEETFTNSMVEEPDGTLRFYSYGTNYEHCCQKHPEETRMESAMLVHTLRADGFACLEPVGGYGYLGTRNLLPRNGDLRINFLAPNGWVRVQASHATGMHSSEAYEGFSFDDCVPLTGDQTNAPVQFKDGRSLDELVGKSVRLEIQLFQAQMYAIHWDFRIQYGDPIMERI